MEKAKKHLLFALLIITLIKLFLVSNMLILVSGYSTHDDALFVRLASNILSGGWLGPYDEYTLIKGVVYPLFIALNFSVGFPLLLTQQLLYIFAGLFFLYTISHVTKNTVILTAIFVFYTFFPLLTSMDFTRVVRDSVYISEMMLLFSSLFGLLLFRNFKWAVYTGLSLSMFWFTREEGVWVIPSVAFTYFVIILNLRNNGKGTLLKTILILTVPFAMLLFFSSLISYVNMKHYGIYTTNEFKYKPYLKAYGALTRVTPKEWTPKVSLQTSTMDEIAKHSPAFSKIKANIDRGWFRGYEEISGGNFPWCLRNMVARAGYYKSAKSTSEFYELLAAEINNLCDSKVLNCSHRFDILLPPIWKYDIHDFMTTLFTAGINAATFTFSVPNELLRSTGDASSLSLFQTITNNIIHPPHKTGKCKVTGWAFKKNSAPLELKLKSSTTAPCLYQISFSEKLRGFDVVAMFNAPSAEWSRFYIETKYDHLCSLGFYDNSSMLVAEAPISHLPDVLYIYDSNVKVHFDKVAFDTDVDFEKTYNIIKKMPIFKYRILNFIATIYNTIFPYSCILALLCYFVNLFIFRKYTMLFFFNTTLIVGIISRLLIISIIDMTFFPTINVNLYMAPATFLLSLFTPLSILDSLFKIFRVNVRHGAIQS
ncbi:MAG: hypothetical protein H7844_02195 [Nitrospirae bacterium YQR-1]